MLVPHRRRLVAVVLVTFMALWAASGRAAILEFSMRQEIVDSVAAMRYLYQQREEARERLKMVRYSVDLTRSQLEAQRELIEETEKGDLAENVRNVRLSQYQETLETLQIHIDKMTQVDWEELYTSRIEEVTEQLEEQKILLNAKLAEYRVHFGGKPPVDLTYEEEVSRLRPKVDRPGLLYVR